jgi:hypothetical protein
MDKGTENQTASIGGDKQKAKRPFGVLSGKANTPEGRVEEFRRRRGEPQPPKFRQAPDKPSIVHEGDLALVQAGLSESLGTTDPDLTGLLLRQIGDVAPYSGMPQAAVLNASLAALHGIKPEDPLESMLATQMIAVHHLAMNYAGRMASVGLDGGIDHIERAAKLMRVFSTQVETLVRYRSRGQQRVVVEHVNIEAGGQAVVGIVNGRGGRGEGQA